MTRKYLLLLILLTLMFVNNTYAQGLSGQERNKKWLQLRERSMDEKMRKLLSDRERVMDEVMDNIIRKQRVTPAYLKPRMSYITKAPEKNNGNGSWDFLSLKNTRNVLGAYFESETEERKISTSVLPTRRKSLLFEENLGTDFKGFLYHPNLVRFDINLENGLRQTRERFQPNLSGELTNSYVNQFYVNSTFLSKKPYVFSLSAAKSREVENREFFERQVVNSTRTAGNFGFRNKFIPVGFSFSNSKRVISRLTRPSEDLHDEELNVSLSNDSDFIGKTDFEFAQDKYSRAESGVSAQDGISRNFNLTNQLFVFGDKRKSLYSGASVYDVAGTNKSRILNFNESLNIEHTDRLNSHYNYVFSDMTSSGVETKDNDVSFSLSHRLYESLISTFSPYYFNSKSTSFSQDTYGLSLDEDYVKKLGKIGKLSLGAGAAYSKEKRKSLDQIISIINESHTLTTGVLTFLDRSQIDTSTVIVTNAAGTITYALTSDYILTSSADKTQIQRVPGGSISDGQEVLVDYQAKASPLLKFNTLENNYRFRIDFLEELFGLFYNVTRERHPRVSGGEDFISQEIVDTTIGLDFKYKVLSVQISDEDYDSTLSPFRQKRIKSSVVFNPTEKSTLTIESSQCRVKLINTDDIQKLFDLISRYSVGLNQYSRFNAEAGLRLQKGSGIDLDDVTAGLGYELNFHKFELDLKYDFRKQLYLNDSLLNHFFSLRIKRVF